MSLVPLRPYQQETIDATRAELRAGRRRIVVVLPTGGGKTVIGSAIISAALEKGSRSLFLAPRRELVAQTTTKLFRAGIEPERVGVIMAGIPARAASLFNETPIQIAERMAAGGASNAEIDAELWARFGARRAQAPVQVGSVQTARLREIGKFNLVIVDECHGARAESYVKLIQSQWDHATVIGLTATPWPPPGKALGDVIDGRPLFETIVPPSKTARQLAEMGYLVVPRMFGVPVSALPDLSDVRMSGEDWNQEDLERVSNTDKLVGDIVDHWKRRAFGLRTVVFAAGVKHSQNIAAAFCAAGIRAEHVDGTTDRKLRAEMFARLNSGETTVLCGCDIFTEGWDEPRVAALVFARMTRSRRLAKQMAGRGLRPDPSKPYVIFLDHAGLLMEHDSPFAEEDYSIAPIKKRRKGAAAVAIKTCPECFAIVSAGVRTCEHCGYVFAEASERAEIEQQDGELVEVPDVSREVKRAAFDALCAERGDRRPGWVIHQFVERFGVKPPKAWKVPLRFEELPESDPGIMKAWMECVESAHRAGRDPRSAAGQFHRDHHFWPTSGMLAAQREHIEADERAATLANEHATEESDRLVAALEASIAPTRMRAPTIRSFPTMEAYS